MRKKKERKTGEETIRGRKGKEAERREGKRKEEKEKYASISKAGAYHMSKHLVLSPHFITNINREL